VEEVVQYVREGSGGSGTICEGGQWRKRYNRELEQLYNEPNIVNVIKSSRLKWVGHVVRMDENKLPKKDTVDEPWRLPRT
jgi:hypothetical protein